MKLNIILPLFYFIFSLTPVYAKQSDDIVCINYQELFKYIAQNTEDVDTDENTIFKLAVDSYIKRDSNYDGSVKLMIIYPNISNPNDMSSIRGASNNGDIFVFRILEKGYQLVGKMDGNDHHFESINKDWFLVTSWHIGGGTKKQSTYKWNGNQFMFIEHHDILIK